MIKVSRCSTCLPFVPSCYSLFCSALCPKADFYRLLLRLPCLSASTCIWSVRSTEGLSEEERRMMVEYNSPGSPSIGSQWVTAPFNHPSLPRHRERIPVQENTWGRKSPRLIFFGSLDISYIHWMFVTLSQVSAMRNKEKSSLSLFTYTPSFP